TARQSLAGSRQDIRLNPQKGILLAHNDDMFGYLLTFFNGFEGNSRHFGWRKNYDPFTGEPPTEPDTIVNYTQRRYRWIDEWLTRNFNIDTTRININGHSMGSRGTTTIAKVYPSHYASATFLNNGFEDLDPPALIDVAFGPTELDFPTNLKGYDGETIHYTHMMNLETRLSSERDLPLMRSFHGKNDTGGSNEWDAYVVNQYRAADSLGIGAQLNWSERSHGPDTGPDYNDHWINGNAYTQQTIVDDIAYEEQFFRSDVSYPAFFNHRLDTKNNDPGDGTPGTGAAGVGDDWGTWGGYHRWDWNDIVDQPDYWSATAWLESNAIFDNDNCPNDFLTSDLAVRKPRMFKPNTGETVYWLVRETGTNQVLQSGVTQVQADNLVVVEQLRIYKKSIGRVLIELSTVASSTNQVENKAFQMNLFPNPSAGAPTLSVHSPVAQLAMLQVSGMTGQVYSAEKPLFSGDNLLVFPELETMPAGVYIVSVGFNRGTTSLKWIKQ
ncbi:MAG: T9SS type A sorting domain-containing protein, partial [Saprospiraceae bacterium]|nr:T9SS type A sorting domain-containing protein [Saprospiraceae bacterium]